MRYGAWLLVGLAVVLGCSRSADRRQYELEGQVLAVNRVDRTITIAHGDIVGFMPGMTMAFPVEQADLLDAASPGDLVRATLVVDDAMGALSSVTVTGHAPLPASAPAPAYDILDPGETVPEVAVVDQRGTAHALSDWRGRALAVTFVYTRCPLPDFCPAMDHRFAEVQEAVAASPALRDRVHLLSFTIDPAFDTPAVLEAHAASLHADPAIWSFVTGDPAALDAFGRRFGVSVMHEGENASDIVHNLRTAVIDPQGRLVTIHTGRDWTAGELVSELQSAAASR